MSAPRPELLQAHLDDIVVTAQRLGVEYRWLHPDAHRQPQRAAREDGGHSRRTHEDGSPANVSDTVIATEHYRSQLEWAARNIRDARNRLLTAVAALHTATGLLDPAATVDRLERALPHPADRKDISQAQEAQERRLERAHRNGDWDEVTG